MRDKPVNPIFQEGSLAFSNGASNADNPYCDSNGENASAWDAVWKHAQVCRKNCLTKINKSAFSLLQFIRDLGSMKWIKNTLLFIAVFIVCCWIIGIVSHFHGDDIIVIPIIAFALASLIVFVWQKIAKRYL
jgi:hypothetical protein